MKFKAKSIFLFSASVARVCWDLIRKKDILASVELADSRLAICERCIYFEPEARQCSECTCFVDVKTQLRRESCPRDQWR